MCVLLIIEDSVKDMRTAERVGASAGFSDVQKYVSVHSAVAQLARALRDEVALPDAIVLDLDFGQDSGYELLRIRRESPRLIKIPLVVWTELGLENRPICDLFAINGYVSKWEGIEALREALTDICRPAHSDHPQIRVGGKPLRMRRRSLDSPL